MAEAVVAFALEALRNSVIEEIELYRVKDEIESIRLELQMMQCFLKDADARQDKDERILQWVKEIKSLSYRIEDALETYAVDVESMKGKGRGKILGAFGFIEKLLVARKAMIEIKALKSISERLKENVEIYGINRIGEERSNSLNRVFCMPSEDLVGLEAEITMLVSFMVEVDKSCPVISISGMGGIGKTALAWRVYNDSLVEEHFSCKAFVYVGRTFQRREILQRILVKLVPGIDESEIATIEEMKLAQKINQILREKKCLVFLDDIWHLDDWKSLRISFSFADIGSKLLLTTRTREVAEVAAGKGYVHTMRPLTEDESWKLFKRKLLSIAGADSHVQAMMDKMGRQILSRCGGLPLAINMLGRSMATKSTLDEWDIVYYNIHSYLNAVGIHEILEVLASGFYDLPYRSKPCFLYLGCFPDGSKIELDKLYLLWMAEGIIESGVSAGREETMMEIADRYLRELELRSLVEVQEEEVPTFKRFKSCTLHGLMRQLCLTKGKEDDFFKVIHFGRGSQGASDSFTSDNRSSRRLVICLDEYESGSPAPLILESARSLRCLLIYSTLENQPGTALPQEISELRKFKLLKALDFDGLDFQTIKLPWGISALIRLRYLSFKGCVLEALPSEIGSLSYLLVLDLRVRPWCKMTISNVLWKLTRLKHLYLPATFKTPRDRMLRLNGLTELETLKQFNTNVCHAGDLLEMTNLRYLAASTEGRVEDLVWIRRRMNMTTEHGLRCSVDIRNIDCYTEERHAVFRQILGCHVLQTISMEGHLGQIPPYHEISHSLMEIIFSGSQLKEDPMLVFEELPNLRVLVLNDDAFLGVEMVCTATSFRELRRLELSNLHYLEKWRIENGALGKLTTLSIESCCKLERLPHGVKFVSNLKNLHIRKMPQAFEKRLCVIVGSVGEDVCSVQHVTSITFDN